MRPRQLLNLRRRQAAREQRHVYGQVHFELPTLSGQRSALLPRLIGSLLTFFSRAGRLYGCLGALVALALAVLWVPGSLDAWFEGLRNLLGGPLPFHLEPFPAPKVRDSALFDEHYHQDLFWGTFRPGFYCGAAHVDVLVE